MRTLVLASFVGFVGFAVVRFALQLFAHLHVLMGGLP